MIMVCLLGARHTFYTHLPFTVTLRGGSTFVLILNTRNLEFMEIKSFAQVTQLRSDHTVFTQDPESLHQNPEYATAYR